MFNTIALENEKIKKLIPYYLDAESLNSFLIV